VPLTPASNAKLLTAAAALSILGPDYRFTTRTLLDAGRHLVLVGGGDPLLSSRAAQPGAVVTELDDLARAVAASRHAITGPLLVDDSRFDSARVVPDWKQIYVTEGDVGPLGALSVDGGFDVVLHKPATDPAVLATTDGLCACDAGSCILSRYRGTSADATLLVSSMMSSSASSSLRPVAREVVDTLSNT